MLWQLFKKEFKNEIIVLLLFVILLIICRIFDITCLFYKITNIPCPTCCMTRALLSLIKGDLRAYANYNIMAFPVFLVFIGELFNGLFGRYKAVLHICCVFVLAINLIYYLDRIGLMDILN